MGQSPLQPSENTCAGEEKPSWLRETVAGSTLPVTLDNHYVHGGQGERVLSQLTRLEFPSPPRTLQLGVREVPACGTNDEVLRHHSLRRRQHRRYDCLGSDADPRTKQENCKVC